MEIKSTPKNNSFFEIVITVALCLTVFILFFYGFWTVFQDLLKPIDLSGFQTLVLLYALIAASSAFTFFVFYLFRVFTRKGEPTAFYPHKIPMLFAVIACVLINVLVIISP